MNIKDFLLARITEDEKLAKDASEPSPNWDRGTDDIYYVVEPVRPYVRDVCIADLENTGRAGRAHGGHIARHDPARVLAECAAKRAIVELADRVETMEYQIMSEWGGDLDGTSDDMLKTLATVYADHPDYQPEWAL